MADKVPYALEAPRTSTQSNASGYKTASSGFGDYAVGLGALGGAVSSIGTAYAQSTAYQIQGNFQASMAKLNAEFAKVSEEDALRRGDVSANLVKKQVKGVIGSQRAGLAAQGIDISSGSALDIQLDTAYQGQIDYLTVKNN